MYTGTHLHIYTHGIALAYVHIFLCTHKHMLQFTVSLSTYLATWVKINPWFVLQFPFILCSFPDHNWTSYLMQMVQSLAQLQTPQCTMCISLFSREKIHVFPYAQEKYMVNRCLYFNSQYVFAHARALCKEGEPCKEATRSFAETWD
jgi:hypothetical protein